MLPALFALQFSQTEWLAAYFFRTALIIYWIVILCFYLEANTWEARYKTKEEEEKPWTFEEGGAELSLKKV